jgi:L-ascorbate metabolism protein UlaG (beta-lactamase superfamily)
MPKLTCLGHAAFLVQGSKGSMVIDPFLSGNPLAKAKPEEIQVDFVLLSHGHGDHLGDAIR